MNLALTLKKWFAGALRRCLRGMCLPLEKPDFFFFFFFCYILRQGIVSYSFLIQAHAYTVFLRFLYRRIHMCLYCTLFFYAMVQYTGDLWAENFQIWWLVSWKFPNLGAALWAKIWVKISKRGSCELTPGPLRAAGEVWKLSQNDRGPLNMMKTVKHWSLPSIHDILVLPHTCIVVAVGSVSSDIQWWHFGCDFLHQTSL